MLKTQTPDILICVLVLGNEGDGEGRGGLKESYIHVNMGGWFETEIRSFEGCVFILCVFAFGGAHVDH